MITLISGQIFFELNGIFCQNRFLISGNFILNIYFSFVQWFSFLCLYFFVSYITALFTCCPSVRQRSEYARISFDIWKGSEYARVTQGSKYFMIWLNMSKYDVNISEYVRIYNNKQGSEYVLYNTIQVNKYLLRDDCIQNPAKDLRAFWKKIIAFNYFRKTLQINSFENVQNVCRDLNMSWF